MVSDRVRLDLLTPAAWPTWLVRTVLLLVPLLLFCESFGYPLLGLDDQGYYDNPAIAGGAWHGLLTLWTTLALSDYAPVSQLTFWLDRALAGNHWWFGHLHQVLWFACGAWGVHALVRAVTSSAGLALAVALLYVMHPIGAESVLWLAERKNLVSFALTIWCVERYVAAVHAPTGWGAAATAWILGILALLAKPHAVCLPFLLIAYELSLGSGPLLRRAARTALPLLLVMAYIAVQLLLLRADLDRHYLAGSRLSAVLVDGQILLQYLQMVVLPQRLTIYYPAPETVQPGAVALSWLLLVVLVALSLVPRQSRRLVAWSWLSALAALSPALNLVPQLAPYADHYLAWALPMLVLLPCVLVRDLIARVAPADQPRLGRLTCAGAGVFLAVLSWSRVPEFASKELLFAKAVVKQPGSAFNWSWHALGLFASPAPADQAAAARAAQRALACVDSWRILPENRALVIIIAAVDLHHQGRHSDADSLVEREVASLPADGGAIADIVRAQVAMRIGQPARAVNALLRFYPQELQEAAVRLRAQCRSGTLLPDALPPQVDPSTSLGGMADVVNLGHSLDNESRQLQTLAYCYQQCGDLERAFDVAAVTVNLVPGDRTARLLLADIDRRLHLDAAAERLMATGATAPPP
jgi:hypothetical protein